MTTDPFTEAAGDRVEELWPYAPAGFPLPPARRMDRRIGFRLGAAWARDHLAAQEPTDDEVRVALGAANRTTLTGQRFDPPLSFYADNVVEGMRAALTAARALRRDEWIKEDPR